MNWKLIQDNLPNVRDVELAIAFLMLKPNFDYDTVVEAAELISNEDTRYKFIDLVLDEIEHNDPEYQYILEECLSDVLSGDTGTVITEGNVSTWLRDVVNEAEDE